MMVQLKIKVLTIEEYDSLIVNDKISKVRINTWVIDYQRIRNRKTKTIEYQSGKVEVYEDCDD